jgi:inosine-uridine nucleoside N-ribohydrolase
LPKSIIMDVDVGVDDALAIILATRSPELDVRAITTVSGNVHVDKTSMNALKVLEVLGSPRIPVAKGMAKPLLRELETAEDFHGKDGLGDSNIPAPKLRLDNRHAVDLLLEETASNPKEITIVATAPLTNLAVATLRDPNFAKNVQQLVIMGGAYNVTPYGYGNANPAAEFNVYVDPEAASIVFNSGIPVTAVGLDITTQPNATLTKDLYQKLERAGTTLTKFAALITRQLMTKYGFIHLHDPMAAAIAADPTLASTKKYHVDVETTSNLTRGQTIADRRDWLPESYKKPPNASICTSVDGERFLKMFFERITRV